MAKFTKYPVYQYDEPATYNEFYGGINSDPASENLEEFELRDCLNMHYSSGSLVKRKGAKLLCTIECEDELYNVQGIFLFTYRLTYIIIAADGKLYQGVYNENSAITLTRLHIRAELPVSTDLYNPINIFTGLPRYYEEQTNIKHDGFLINYAQIESRYYTYNGKTLIGYYMSSGQYAKNENGEVLYTDPYTQEPKTAKEMHDSYPDQTIDQWSLYPMPTQATYVTSVIETKPYNYVGKFNELDNSLLQINDVVEYFDGKKYILYTTKNNMGYFRVSSIKVNDERYWIPFDRYHELYQEQIHQHTDPIARRIQSGIPVDGIIVKANNEYELSSNVPAWDNTKAEWASGEVAQYEDNVYVCIKSHYVYTDNPTDTSQWSEITEVEELIFQNYRKIQSATLDNKLYITTGTLFVEVELINNNLVAHPVAPYVCNNTEINQIGYNYLSPYPEYCRDTEEETATTSIGGLLAVKKNTGDFELRPQMTFAAGESYNDYYFKWEKKLKVANEEKWYTVISFKDAIEAAKTGTNYYNITVNDADKYIYRVTFAKSFEQETYAMAEWSSNVTRYEVGDFCMVGASLYKCITAHKPDAEFKEYIAGEKKQRYKIIERRIIEGKTYDTEFLNPDTHEAVITSDEDLIKYYTGLSNDSVTIYALMLPGQYETIQEEALLWQKVYEEEAIDIYADGETGKGTDLTVDEVDGSYFGSATSILFVAPTNVDDTYKIIQSCTKIVKDNNKFLLYGDNYNSGSWYKTVTNNPAYISNRGSLSFKTTKNEELVAVVLFNGNIVAFANSENIGGSIHLVVGSGDDYSADDYYSPYRKSVINSMISCDNADTVQVCENILVFKYFDTLYYITSSELTNETVSVYSCNDKIKSKSPEVDIPWDDNDCYSEVTEDYYALCWREKYIIEDDDLILERPAMRIKMYYKMSFQSGNKYHYPWMRDESPYFNSTAILYIKGKPIYLYNNTLITYNENVYTDLDKAYECKVHFRGVDINYPKIYKLINNVLVYYHRTQHSAIDFNLTVKNEAGHILIDSTEKRFSLQDLRALRVGDKIEDGAVRLDPTITDTKVYNASYRFPCLIADATISATNDQEFSIASITYNYLTTDVPETNPYDLYTSIIRPKETK